jgi:uncharacterized protein involved in response to NO
MTNRHDEERRATRTHVELDYARLRDRVWYRRLGVRSATVFLLLLVLVVAKVAVDATAGLLIALMVAALLLWELLDWHRARERARAAVVDTQRALPDRNDRSD